MKSIVMFGALLSSLVSYPAISSDELSIGAKFYTEFNYYGNSYYYPESNAIINLDWTDLNDTFKSLDVGEISKVLAWRHSTDDQGNQYYKIYDNDSPNISEMQGLTKFKVIPKQSEEVLIRLIDTTGSNKRYCLYANVYSPDAQASEVIACTDDPYYQVVGYIINTGQQIVSSLQVRNAEPLDPDYGKFINSGSVYYVSVNGDVDISTENDALVNFPLNMSYEVLGNNRIDFKLTSIEPSFPE